MITTHSTSTGTAAGQAEPVPGEAHVTPVESTSNSRPPADGDDAPETRGRVQLPEDLDANDPGPVRQPAMNFGHQLFVRLVESGRIEVRAVNVGESDALPTIPAAQQADFSQAEGASAVVEDFEFPGRLGGCFGCGPVSSASAVWLVMEE